MQYQIGQCRVLTDKDKTIKFYRSLPKISENCGCENCHYFETIVTEKEIRLFTILKEMGVDLTRQPAINPDGICPVGPTEKYARAYIGYYQVFGKFGKTQRTPQTLNSEGKLESVGFFEPEDDSYTEYKVKQQADDQLIIEFYLECEKNKTI